jgi:peptidoglycan-associated lipoprotein
MHKNFRIIGVASLLLLVAACSSKKKLAELPPAPPQAGQTVGQSTGDDQTGLDTGNVANAFIPGSQEEFAAQTGSDHVLFDTDGFELDQEARTILTAHARWLAEHPGISAVVEGHCDERGTREYNLALGERRALSAKNFLVAQGIDVRRLRVVSYGKERPSVERSDESAWAQNRRAVTVVVGS